jgi:hypothetical protein
MEMPAGRLWGRLKRAAKRREQEMEKESKEFVVGNLMEARSIFYGLQNTQDLPPLPSEAKKKPNEQKIKKARDQMEQAQEAYYKAISHPYFFEEYMGLSHSFEAPEEPDQHTSDEFREQRRKDTQAREQRFSATLRSIGEASGNQFPQEG